MRWLLGFAVLSLLGLGACDSGEDTAPAPEAAETTVCDRDCLIGFADRYIAALVAHAPETLPLSDSVQYTENAQTLAPGDGLWGTASAEPDETLYITDPEAGQVGLFAAIEESGDPAILFSRLKVADDAIGEIETIIVRPDAGLFEPDGVAAPFALMNETVPPDDRTPRDAMIAIADSYFEALETNTGDDVPFTDDCQRVENGVQTTGNPDLPPAPTPEYNVHAMGCAENVRSRVWSYITEINERRFVAVDEERGLVLGMAMFHHDGVPHPVEIEGVGPVDRGAGRPFSGVVAELFKVVDGRIRYIEAVLRVVPYKSDSGWSE